MATESSSTNQNGRTKPANRIEVRKSSVHGRGVFARIPIRKGARIIEYTGRRLPWKEAQDLPSSEPRDPFYTVFFEVDGGNVIDAAVGGNEARWINHSCDPNCETLEEDGRVFIYARRDLEPGEELFYDYKMIPAERRTRKVEREFACFCGASKCRGTMLAPRKKRKRGKK